MDGGAEAQRHVREDFGTFSQHYVESPSNAHGEDLDLLLAWADPHPEWVALDVATGGGHAARILAPHVSRVVAVDLAAEMLRAASSHLSQSGVVNAVFVVADAERLPFLDETFDLVMCRVAAHHFPCPEKFVKEVARVLRTGGTFVLTDHVAPEDDELAAYVNELERLRDESHVRCLSVREWSGLLAGSDLAVEQFRTRKKQLDFSRWAMRTAKNYAQLRTVQKFACEAAENERRYFQIEIADGRVQSFQLDEWMALSRKIAD